MTRRVLSCRLDAQVERPDQLEYDFDPRDEVMEQRPELVTAGLTVLRAYIAAGQPESLKKIGSFEKWCMIREALVWLGRPDPADTRERILTDDPQKGELIDLLHLWWEVFKDRRITLAELNSTAENDRGGPVVELAGELISKTKYPAFNTRSIGRFLGTQIDRIAGGLVLYSETDSSGVKQYWVVNIAERNKDSSKTKEMPF